MPNKAGIAWRLLWLSLLCCVFEGAARKWFVGDGSIAGRLAYESKSIFLAGLFTLGAGRASRLTDSAWPFLQIGLGLLSLGALLSCISGFEPIGAALTIRTFFILPAAAWMGGRLLPSDSLRRFALWIAILSLPLAVLGLLQFYSPSSSWINRYSTAGEHVATAAVSERVRATGTFSYISGLGVFATVAVWAGIVTFTLARTHRDRWLGYAGLVAGMCCTFVTVSRSVALNALVLLAVWAVAGGRFGRKAQIVVTIGTVGMAVVFLMGWGDEADEIVTTVYQRHMSGGNKDTVSHRLLYHFVDPLEALQIAPLGEGLGSQQSAVSLFADDARRAKTSFESSWGKTIMEVGVFGLLGFVMTWGIAFAPLRTAFQTYTQSEARTTIAVTGAALLISALMGFQFNHVAVYFFWATIAAFLALGNGISLTRRTAPPINVRSG